MFALASAAATVVSAKMFWGEGNLPEVYDRVYDDEIAPVVVLHGLNGNCNQIQQWVTDIDTEIGGQAVVKCLEIGDGNVSSIFERMEWQINTVCHKIHNDPDFAGKEISIVGIS